MVNNGINGTKGTKGSKGSKGTKRRNGSNGGNRIEHYQRRLIAIAALVLTVALSGCASLGGTGNQTPDDPLEPMNRVVFGANLALDKAIIKPAAKGYRAAVPQFVRDRIRSVIDNLLEPRIFANNVLQLRVGSAGTTLARFLINSTVGLAGMFDPASEQGLSKQSGDFGQTLYTWGVDSGPYLVLPFFGPTNFRDALGLGVDLYTTPLAHLVGGGDTGRAINLSVGTVDGIDLRSRNIESLDAIETNALDFYAQLRSIARQRREAQLREGRGLKDAPEELVDPGATLE